MPFSPKGEFRAVSRVPRIDYVYGTARLRACDSTRLRQGAGGLRPLRGTPPAPLTQNRCHIDPKSLHPFSFVWYERFILRERFAKIWRYFGALEGSGQDLGRLGELLRQSSTLGGALGTRWARLGWAFGGSWARLGRSWKHFGSILKPSWSVMEPSWNTWVTSGERLRGFFGRLSYFSFEPFHFESI